jgi:hypothetical protein
MENPPTFPDPTNFLFNKYLVDNEGPNVYY